MKFAATIQQKSLKIFAAFTLAFVLLPSALIAQSMPDLKSKAKELYDANRFSEALPLLERIAQGEPGNGEYQYYLAFALIGHAMTVPEPAIRKELRIRGAMRLSKPSSLV